MASIVREVVVEAGAAECWDAVRDFAALRERLAPGFITGLHMVSPREREITFSSGAVAREYLVGIAADRRRLVYTIVESPMGSSHHNASVEVIPQLDARCRLVWITDVLPDELADRTGALMDRGIAVIKETLEAARRRA